MNWARRFLAFAVLLALLGSWSQRAAAAPPASESASAAPPGVASEQVAPDSPRAALKAFRHLTRIGDYSGAAAYLDLSAVDQNDGPDLARELREVLNRHLAIDVNRLSADSQGRLAEGPSTNQVLLGSVPGATGLPEPVTLRRNSYQPGSHWMFSADTVAHVQSWYEHLGNIWLIEHLPKPLLRMGPYHIRRWQWLALVPLLVGGWLLGLGATRVARVAVRLALERDAPGLHKLRGPAALAVAVAIWYACLPDLGLYEQADAEVRRWFSAALLLALFWAVWKAVELSQRSVGATRWAKESLTAHSLLLLGARLAKFVVAAIAFIVVLAKLGYHATTIITGLGIGGVALALAAQKTVENLFGAFSLAVDQPFREGDSITVDGINGTVEIIGLRSTRIRTADRTLVSIPNGKLAEMRVETITRQDRLRFYVVVGVVHSPAEQLKQMLQGITRLLQNEPLIDKASIGVHLIGFTDAAMNIEIGAMFNTLDGSAFANARQALLLGIVAVIEQAGSALWHPPPALQSGVAPQLAPGPDSQRDLGHEPVPESGSRGAARAPKHR